MTGRLILCAVALALLGTESIPAQQAETETWKIDGDTRRAIVYPPSAPWPGLMPVVLNFHGHGDNIESFQNTGMQDAWPEALVVYFQGLPSSRDGLSGWQVEKGQDNDRDLKLVDAALASLRRKYRIDDSRVYATGFSNGANFTYLLWAERPDVFAAFAPVAARLRPSVQPQQPKPVLHIAGKKDRQIPYEDQLAAIETAKRVNGTAAPVKTWLHSGGHEYPGNTADRIAYFFRGYRNTSKPR